MPQPSLENIKIQLESADDATRDAVFKFLRQSRQIHRLENEWGTTAEFILEAIARSQDITKRGVRGIIAELAFSEYVLKPLKPRWTENPLSGDLPYDSQIVDSTGKISIQTKNQRLEKGKPLHPNASMIKRSPSVSGWFIAETQKTRSGQAKDLPGETITSNGTTKKKKKAPGNSTRPYRFGEFDILSVCLHPSTGDWTKFMYTPARTLIPSSKDPKLIATFQPVPNTPIFAWTDNLEKCIEWVRDPTKCPAVQPTAPILIKAKKTTSRAKPRNKKKH